MPQIKSLTSKITALMKRITNIRFIKFMMRVWGEMNEDDGTNMAAGVAYYAFLSLFPLLLGIIALWD